MFLEWMARDCYPGAVRIRSLPFFIDIFLADSLFFMDDIDKANKNWSFPLTCGFGHIYWRNP